MLRFNPEITEQEWLQELPCDFWAMWRSMPHRLRRDPHHCWSVDRKLQLLVVALGWQVTDLLTDQRAFDMLLAAERYADHAGESETMAALHEAVERVTYADEEQPTVAKTCAVDGVSRLVSSPHDAAPSLMAAVGFRAAEQAGHTLRSAAYECAEFAAAAEKHELLTRRLIREVFGNPFRSIVFCPGWRTSTAVALASQMYEARDFSAMPILADTLQDAGCDHADILDHCRSPGSHVRGCWVVDHVLGKE